MSVLASGKLELQGLEVKLKEIVSSFIYLGAGGSGVKSYSLNTDGSSNSAFITGTGFDSIVNSVVIQSDGKILIGGGFTTYQGVTRNRIIRLNTDGSIDNTFDIGTGFDNSVSAIVVQPDGKILVGGWFITYRGVTSNKIIRLNTDGSIDNTFDIGTGFDGSLYAITLQSDGKILVGGQFTTYNGVFILRIIRLNIDGSIDNTFSPGVSFNNTVTSIAVQTDGKIVAGGWFNTYRDFINNRIIRINTDGSIDNTFSTGDGFNSSTNIVSLQSDGKILVGGLFSEYNGIVKNKIARLNTDGSIDNTFDIGTGFDNSVSAIVVQPDGKILVGGGFSEYNGDLASRFTRLNSGGTLDATLIPFAYSPALITSIAVS